MKNLLLALCAFITITATAQRPGTQPMFEPIKFLDDAYSMRDFGFNTVGPRADVDFNKVAIRILPLGDTMVPGHVLTLQIVGSDTLAKWAPATGGGGGGGYWTLSGDSLYPTDLGNNVGIGTASPQWKFHVIGDTAAFHAEVQVGVDGEPYTWIGNTNGGSHNVGIYFVDDDLDVGSNNGANGSTMSYRVGGTMSMRSNGVTTMTLDAANNVGIGTASPAKKLHVEGEVYAITSGLSKLHDLRWASGDTINKVYVDFEGVRMSASGNLGYSYVSTDDNGQLRIYGSDNTYIQAADGMVRIGSTSPPTEKLDVTGNIKLSGDIISATNGAGIKLLSADGTCYYLTVTDLGVLDISPCP